MKRSNAPTLQDIANEAGVTAMTVSVVLNGSRSATRVSDATRARIQEVAARMRYRPNAVARGLSRRRMDTLGVVATIDVGDVNLYFLELLNGILEECAIREQNTTVFAVKDWSDENRILQFCDGRVDGVIFISPALSPSFGGTLQERTPFVTIHSSTPIPSTTNLDIDNEAAAYHMVRYLIGLGHLRIMHVSGGTAASGSRERIAGYKRALLEAGIVFDPSLLVHSHYTSFAARVSFGTALKHHAFDVFPTAIFCANDAIAIGCMEVLTEYGLKVPDDISIAGFDDTLIARMTVPKLTTVRQPFRELGRRAVDILLEHTADSEDPYNVTVTEAAESPTVVFLDHTLQIRDSVGVPRITPIQVP